MVGIKLLPMRSFYFYSLAYASSLFSCPFCDPEVIQKQSFLSEGTALGICTNHPMMPGHVLVIPQRHVERFEELTDEEVSDLGAAIRRVHEAAKVLFGNNDYLLLQKNGKAAGQSVPHVHYHYYPRSEKMGTIGFIWRFLIAPYRRARTDAQLREQASAWKRVLGSRKVVVFFDAPNEDLPTSPVCAERLF